MSVDAQISVTIGVDEVGRGCWAGPLVAGAVALRSDISGLADSKVLTAKKRQYLTDEIVQHADAYGLGWVTALEVDTLGLTEAVRLAMSRAVDQVLVAIGDVEHRIIVDGNYNYLSDYAASCAIVRADGSVPAVSAASIVAKVARDTFMVEADRRYPHYGFAKHVGYGTAVHKAALQQYGPCPLHRLSYKPLQNLK